MGLACDNAGCAHRRAGACSLPLDRVSIDASGACAASRRNAAYYLARALASISRKNYVDAVELNADPALRTGLYILVRAYRLDMEHLAWGTCEMVLVKVGDETRFVPGSDEKALREASGLKARDIEEHLEIDVDEMRRLDGLVAKGADRDPKLFREDDATTESSTGPSRDDRRTATPHAGDYGWLSPTGDFTPADFSEHEKTAREIIERRGWKGAFRAWVRRHPGIANQCRDYLAEVKGYALIHDPTGQGAYLVSHRKALTKSQNEFLFGYFSDIGKPGRAAAYAADDG